MPRRHVAAALLLAALGPGLAGAQTIAMGRGCRAQLATVERMNADRQFDSALVVLDTHRRNCATSDGKEAFAAATARAYNGLGRHADAVGEAQKALAQSKGRSIAALFERAVAREALGAPDSAAADFARITDLTARNRNVKQRATIHAKLAALHWQAGRTAAGDSAMAAALALDPANMQFVLLQGDAAARRGDYDAAFVHYDKAVAAGATDLPTWLARTGARLRQVQEKHGTTEARALRDRMTADEKAAVCGELAKAQGAGLRDMKLDLFGALVCK